MYNAQLLSTRIRKMVKEKGLLQKEMLSACELNENSLNQISDKKGLSSFSLAKIADYLDCSTDYLLGRVNVPNGTYFITGDNNVQVNGNNSPTTVNNSEHKQQDTMVEEFIQIFEKLNFADKLAVMDFAMSKANK